MHDVAGKRLNMTPDDHDKDKKKKKNIITSITRATKNMEFRTYL